ncbi:MAG: hypothetical protein WCR52_12740 [Bacteroidota bacterium]
MKNLRFLILLLALTGAFQLPAQSPWVRSRAGAYVQAAWHFIPSYKSVFDGNGDERTLERKLTENTFQLYGEYGLSKRLTAVVNLPFRYIKSGGSIQNSPQTSSGYVANVGNVSVALRYNILQKRIPVTFSLRADAPANAYNNSTGLRTGYNAYTVMPMLSAGMGFGQAYAFAYAGYAYRSNGYSHYINAGAEGGIKTGRFWIIAFSEWIYSLENGNIKLPANNLETSLFVNDQGYLSIGFKGMYSINRFFGVVLSTAGAVQAYHLPRNPGLGLGLYFKWD